MIRKLKIGIIELVTNAPTRSLWARVMYANFANIMPQAIAVWCEDGGHNVTYLCYRGLEDLAEEFQNDFDIVFIGAYTQCAQLAYALSSLFRSKGAVTALGGPHARSYPQDASKYFDYVFGLTDRDMIRDVLQDCSEHRPLGLRISANQQPSMLPGVRQRWKFIEKNLNNSPVIKVVPMISSLGCPYTCSFCIDSTVPFQQLSLDMMKEDLRFLLQKFKRPRVGWFDPNFGVRFDECIGAIEEVVPPGSIDFYAESSLSLLSEPHLKRLKRNGFKVIMPGIESWYEMGNKSKTGKKGGIDKVLQVSEHINMILSYIPYLQANFVLGLDVDEGPEPFELTKRFVDIAPGAFPAYSMLSAFGESAPLNLEYERANRILPFPFHFLNTQQAMNVKPKNYSWPEFYEHLVDVTKHTFSLRAITNRFRVIKPMLWRCMNVLRAFSSQGTGRVKYHTEVLNRLRNDRKFRDFFEQETTELPQFYLDRIRNDLGPLWEWLPEGALYYDSNVYSKSEKMQFSIESTVMPQSEPAA
jgi:hypothetical protein